MQITAYILIKIFLYNNIYIQIKYLKCRTWQTHLPSENIMAQSATQYLGSDYKKI